MANTEKPINYANKLLPWWIQKCDSSASHSNGACGMEVAEMAKLFIIS